MKNFQKSVLLCLSCLLIGSISGFLLGRVERRQETRRDRKAEEMVDKAFGTMGIFGEQKHREAFYTLGEAFKLSPESARQEFDHHIWLGGLGGVPYHKTGSRRVPLSKKE